MAELSSTLDNIRLKHTSAYSSISPAALELFHSDQIWYSGLSQLLAVYVNHLNSDINNVLASVRDSRSTLFRSAGPLFDEFRAHLNNENDLEDAIMSSSNERLPVIFNTPRSCCFPVACCASLYPFVGLCSATSTLDPTLLQRSNGYFLSPWRCFTSMIPCLASASLTDRFYLSGLCQSTPNSSPLLCNPEHIVLIIWN